MKVFTCKKLVCVLVLSGLFSSLYAGGLPTRVLRIMFLEETKEQLTRNLASLSIEDNVELSILNGLKKTADAYAELGEPKIQMLAKEQVWPDEAEARYVFKAYLRSGIEEGDQAASAVKESLPISLGASAEKYIYKRILDEQILYKPEMQAAFDIYMTLLRAAYNRTLDTLETKEAAKTFMNTKVVSNELRRYLEKDIATGNMMNFLSDVEEYYGIDDNEAAENAFNFFTRHKGRTLALRRALYSPFAPSATVRKIKQFLQKDTLTPLEANAFRSELKFLFTTQKELYSSVLSSYPVRHQKQLLATISDELDKFLSANGHMPRWNSPNSEERKLAMDWEVVNSTRDINDFGTFRVYYNQIDLVLKKFGFGDNAK